MKSPKDHYELAFLAKPDLSETELASLMEKVSTACSQEQPLLKSDPAKKIKLAYPIKKQGEAFLVSISFQADPQTVLKIKKEIDSSGDIIRFLIIKKRTVLEEPKTSPTETAPETEQIITAPTATEPEVAITEAPAKKEKGGKKTASMEDIEKDLEKILGE